MKVLLFTLDASYIHKSLALRCLNKALEREGFETSCVEFTIKEKRLNVLETLALENADIYCFSCYIWNIDEMLKQAEKLKKILPESVIVMGGPEVSYETDDFFSLHPYIDFIIKGEGEESLPELCRNILKNGTEKTKDDGRIIRSFPYENFTDEGIVYTDEEKFSSSVIYYESSRGCPFSCAYCLSASEHGIRSKDADRVLDELLEFEKYKGIKIIKFVDRTFNSDRKRAYKIWRGLISDKYTCKYHFEICADLLDEEGFEILAQFPKGKIQLEAGVQSTNPRTLAAINRSGNTKQCIANIERVKKFGNIHIHADLIAGLPFEDINSFSRSFDDVYGSCNMFQLGFLKLLKGSPLYGDAERYGIVCSSNPPYEVLKTDVLTFEDLCNLHRISDVLDRVSNSGHFSFTLEGIENKIKSPFAFFSGLAEYIGNIDNLSQLNLFKYLKNFCESLGVIDKKELAERLKLDYYMYETGTSPKFLSCEEELPVTPEYIKNAIKKAGTELHVPSFEIHRFNFDPTGYYAIDRKKHICSRMVEKELI